MAAERVEQAGAVVFRAAGSGPEILVVQARKQPEHWIFPKGHIEPGERAGEAAVREAREEAGVIGRFLRPLDPPIEFQSGARRIRVRYFLVAATGETPAHEPRAKLWLPPRLALATLTHDEARALLRAALPEIAERVDRERRA